MTRTDLAGSSILLGLSCYLRYSLASYKSILPMCGIYFSCTQQKTAGHCGNSLGFLERRGPDSFKSLHREVKGKTSDNSLDNEPCVFYLTFIATVLSLRGDCIVEQPLEDKQSGSLLCWNGEAWKINGAPIFGNDAVAVLDLLVKAVSLHTGGSSKDISSDEEASRAVLDVLSTIAGPSAFVFYDAQFQRLYYGRDALGRRSLLQKIDGSGSLKLSSICDSSEVEDWAEVEPGCIYRYEIAIRDDLHQSSLNVSSMRKTDKNSLINTQCLTNIDWLKQMHFSVQPPFTSLSLFPR